MAQIISGIGQTKILTNLDTYNHTALSAALYTVSVQVSEIPPSGMTVTIQQNGTNKAVSVLPAVGQGTIQLQVLLQCAINDVIGVILSSSVALPDGLPNTFKALLNMRIGQV